MILPHMKNIIFYISNNQNIEEKEELCPSGEVWAKAQSLAEHYTFSLVGNPNYSFPNKRFFNQNYQEVSKELLQGHLKSNREVKTLKEYMNKRCLWIYNSKNKVIVL